MIGFCPLWYWVAHTPRPLPSKILRLQRQHPRIVDFCTRTNPDIPTTRHDHDFLGGLEGDVVGNAGDGDGLLRSHVDCAVLGLYLDVAFGGDDLERVFEFDFAAADEEAG